MEFRTIAKTNLNLTKLHFLEIDLRLLAIHVIVAFKNRN